MSGPNRLFKLGRLRFRVPPGVYPPAEDTELLAEVLLGEEVSGLRVLDVGTGCGILGILASARGAAMVVGVDVNPSAVAAARENAEAAGLDGSFEARLGDLFSPIRDEKFDLVISNPPYLAEEPRDVESAAWAGGLPRGRAFLDRLLRGLPEVLSPAGRALILQSVRNGIRETIEEIASIGLTGRIVGRRALRFEELVVWEITWRAP